MGETIVVTDDSGTEYEVDEDDLRKPKTISFYDNGSGELEIPYNSDYEIANVDSMYGNFVVGYDCDELHGYGSRTKNRHNLKDSWNRTWVFDEMSINE
jgi:hypothetical protein